MRRHIKYLITCILAILTVFIGGGLAYFYFTPVDNATFDKQIGIDTTTDQIYENYSFSENTEKDHSYTLYFFPSVYYMNFYKSYLADPVNNPKPEEVFGSFEIESDDVLRIPKKDPNNTSFYKINNYAPKGEGIAYGGKTYTTYSDLMTATASDANYYPFSKNDYGVSVYPTNTDSTPAFRNGGTLKYGKNDRYGGWGDYDSKVVVSTTTNETVYEGGYPKISTPGTNEKYVERRYLPLKLNIKYSISVNEFHSFINYPVVNFAAENQGMENNTNCKWTVASSKKGSDGKYSLVADYTDVNTSFFASDTNTFFDFDKDLNNYITAIDDLPDKNDSHVIRIFPQFKETKNVGKISSGYPTEEASNSGRDCVFIIGRNSAGNSTTKLWRTFDYVGDNYQNDGSNKYGTNTNVFLATGRDVVLSDDYGTTSTVSSGKNASTINVDPVIFGQGAVGQYSGHSLAFNFIKDTSMGVDYTNKHINIYALVTNSCIYSSTAQSLLTTYSTASNLLFNLANDKANFPSLYKKDLQYDFTKIGFKVTNSVGTTTNEVAFKHKGTGLTDLPAGYIFLFYEVIDDIHLYKDTYDTKYFSQSGKDVKTFYNDYFKNNYNLTRTFSKIDNCYEASTDALLESAINGTGTKVNDTNPNVYIYRNADFTNIRYIYAQLASYHGQMDNPSWIETTDTQYSRLYYKEKNSTFGRVFTKLDTSMMDYSYFNTTNNISNDCMLGLKFLSNRAKSIYDIILVRRTASSSTIFSSKNVTIDGKSRNFEYYYDIYVYRQNKKFVKIFDGNIDLGTVENTDINGHTSNFINHYTTTNLIFEKDYYVGDMMSSLDQDTTSNSSLITILKNKYSSSNSHVYLYDYTTKKKVLEVDLTAANEGISIRSYETPNIDSSTYEVVLDASNNITMLYFYRILENKILYCLPI